MRSSCWSGTSGSRRLASEGLRPASGRASAGKEVLLVAACLDNDVLTGNMDGELQLWKGTSPYQVAFRSIRALSSRYASRRLSKCWTNGRILTGGKDCTIKVLGKDLKVKCTIEMYRYIPNSFDAHVRAIAFNDQKSRFAVGLYSGEIYEFSYTSLEADMKAVVTEVNQSHFARSSRNGPTRFGG
jgi:WD40 repeat protein